MAQRELWLGRHALWRSVGRGAFELVRALATVAAVLAVTVMGGLLVRRVRREQHHPGAWLDRPWLWLLVALGATACCILAARIVRRRRRARDAGSD
jgi:hypothetical protein